MGFWPEREIASLKGVNWMGWIFAIVLFVVGCFIKNTTLVVASGLFAIAGAVGSVAVSLDRMKKDAGESKVGDGGDGVAK